MPRAGPRKASRRPGPVATKGRPVTGERGARGRCRARIPLRPIPRRRRRRSTRRSLDRPGLFPRGTSDRLASAASGGADPAGDRTRAPGLRSRPSTRPHASGSPHGPAIVSTARGPRASLSRGPIRAMLPHRLSAMPPHRLSAMPPHRRDHVVHAQLSLSVPQLVSDEPGRRCKRESTGTREPDTAEHAPRGRGRCHGEPRSISHETAEPRPQDRFIRQWRSVGIVGRRCLRIVGRRCLRIVGRRCLRIDRGQRFLHARLGCARTEPRRRPYRCRRHGRCSRRPRPEGG
jgi:hypothetical protein